VGDAASLLNSSYDVLVKLFLLCSFIKSGLNDRKTLQLSKLECLSRVVQFGKCFFTFTFDKKTKFLDLVDQGDVASGQETKAGDEDQKKNTQPKVERDLLL